MQPEGFGGGVKPRVSSERFRRGKNVGKSDYLAQNIVDRRVERRQLEGLDEHGRVHPLEEKLDGRIVRVAGKKNEPLSSSRSYPRDRPIKHLASHPRHHHIADDEIEAVLHDLVHALDAARDRGYLKMAGDQVFAENLPEIIAIFQEQNPLGRPGYVVRGNLVRGSLVRGSRGNLVRGNLNLESAHLRGICMSRKGARRSST
jgi:hypothetical protein